jgi:HEAT repeat protein
MTAPATAPAATPGAAPALVPAIGSAPAAGATTTGDKAIRDAVARLAGDDLSSRATAQTELRNARGAAVPALIDALGDPEPKARLEAVKMLGELGDPRAAEPLADLLGDPSKTMWDALWTALRSLRKHVAPALIASLASNDQTIRRRAAELMGSIRDARFTEPLIEQLNKDRSTGVRVQIAEALGRIKDRAACEALLDALHDW